MGESSINSSTATATAPGTTTAQAEQQRGYLLAQGLVLVGAALVAAGVWLPWSSGTPILPPDASFLGQPQAFQISAGAVDGVLSLAPWSAATVAGVLLCCCFAVRGPLLVRRLAAVCYLLWTFVALAIITPTLLALLTVNPVRVRPVLGFLEFTVTHSVRPAMLITYLGMLLALAAAVVGLLALRGAPAAEVTPGWAPITRKLPASGVLTFGVVLFLLGIVVMPWATVNCTQTPLFLGQCTGVNFAGATSAGIRANANIFDPLAARYAIPVLLIGGAALLLLGIWRRGLIRAGGFWLTLWLLVATAFAVLGDLGVGAIIANPFEYGLTPGNWSGDSGIAAAFLGLLLGWGAALYLGILALRRYGKKRPEAA